MGEEFDRDEEDELGDVDFVCIWANFIVGWLLNSKLVWILLAFVVGFWFKTTMEKIH